MISKYTSSRLFQYFALLILLLLTVVFHLITKFSFTNVILPKNKPEYIAKLVTGRLFSPQGLLKYKVVSYDAIKYPNLNQVLLTKFDLDGYGSNNALAYKLVAKEGWYDYYNSTGYIGREANLMILSNTTNQESAVIKSSGIFLDLNQHIERSKEQVKIVQGKSTITADGFIYKDIPQILYLESNVEIDYVQ